MSKIKILVIAILIITASLGLSSHVLAGGGADPLAPPTPAVEPIEPVVVEPPPTVIVPTPTPIDPLARLLAVSLVGLGLSLVLNCIFVTLVTGWLLQNTYSGRYVLKLLWPFAIIVVLTTRYSFPALVYAQGGCTAPGQINTGLGVKEAVALTTPKAEQPSQQVPGAFFETTVTITYQPGDRWMLSSAADQLAASCVDDVVEITGQNGQMTIDYRSADHNRIEYRDPLETEITQILVPGSNTLTIRLMDIGNVFSNSSLYLVSVEGLLPIPTPTPTATSTTEVAVIVPTTQPPTTTPPATPTSVPTVEPIPTEVSTQAWWWSWKNLLWLIGGSLSGLVLTIFSVRQMLKAPTLAGELEFYKQGVYVKTISLTEFIKPILTIGAGTVDIWLPGHTMPQLAAKLYTSRLKGETHINVTIFTGSGEVLEEQRLRHEDSFYLGDYRLIYKNYAEVQPIIPIGELSDV